jgi:hypothetical protein
MRRHSMVCTLVGREVFAADLQTLPSSPPILDSPRSITSLR